MSELEPIPEEVELIMTECIGVAIAVHRELGPGFKEIIYRRAYCLELDSRGFHSHDAAFEGDRSKGNRLALRGWTLLRLPGAVKQVFEERVRVAMPLAADKILHRIRETRGGKPNMEFPHVDVVRV